MSPPRVLWAPQPGPQTALLSCPADDVLYGGARGGGKTDALIGDWVSHADRYGRGARGVIFRRSYPELEEILTRSQEIYGPLGAVLNVSRMTWGWPNGALLKMRHLENESDHMKYQGHSYSWMAFDEITHWPSAQHLDRLRACLRSALGVRSQLRVTANPGGPGHSWVKSRYVDPAPPMTSFPSEDGGRRVYIPARLDDNQALVRNDPNYWRRVEAAAGGREDILRAWRYGDWNIVAGGMFDDCFGPGSVLDPFPIPDSWRIDRSFDWGSSKPFSVCWWAESNGEQPRGQARFFPPGSLIMMAEWYGSTGKPNEGTRMLAVEIARGILEKERSMDVTRRVRSGPADPSIFASENGVNIADDMARIGVRWDAASHAPGSRIAGWERMRRMLLENKKPRPEEPVLAFFSTCRHALRTIPTAPRDTRKPDDVDTASEDHIADAVRYRVMGTRNEPRQVNVQLFS